MSVLKSSDLIRSIKRRAMLPSDQNTFTDEDFLEMATEEIQYFGVPHLLSTHEEYLVNYIDLPIPSSAEIEAAGGEARFAIPYRAVGNKLRDVFYVDSANNYYELGRIQLEDRADYNENYFTDYPEIFYIENNDVVLLDNMPESGSMRLYYYLKPSALVKDDEAGVISSIDRNTGVITISNSKFPSNFANLPLIDFVKAKSPNKIFSYDIQPTSVNTSTKTLTFATSDIPTDLAVGDYINVAGESIVPQVPEELQPIIAQRVAVAALEALGDEQGHTTALRRLKMMEQATLDLIDNRVEGSPEKINNRHSTLSETCMGKTRIRRRGY